MPSTTILGSEQSGQTFLESQLGQNAQVTKLLYLKLNVFIMQTQAKGTIVYVAPSVAPGCLMASTVSPPSL